MKAPSSRTIAATLTLVSAAAFLVACSPSNDNRTAGEKVDATVAQVEQKATEMKSDIKSAGNDAAQAAERGTDSVTNKVKDAAITTAVNAKLVADPSLSALKIDVDTVGGNVVLRGTAPTAAARDNASALASHVDGVAGVDNQLVVSPKN